MPDSLDLWLDRSLVLAMGPGGSGKSSGVAHLVKAGEERGFNVVLIDFDGRIRKAIRGVIGHIPENLDYFLADDWQKALEGVDHAFKTLDARDWLVLEMMGTMWERATEYFSEEVYGKDKADHLLARRAEAEEKIRDAKGAAKSVNEATERMASTAFGGYEGRNDWVPIKKQHNGKVRDRLTSTAKFNILATTATIPLSKEDENKWPDFKDFGARPDGEKNNYYKFDTIMALKRSGNKFTWRTDLGGWGKDCEHELVRDIDCTGVGFVQSYYNYHGLEL